MIPDTPRKNALEHVVTVSVHTAEDTAACATNKAAEPSKRRSRAPLILLLLCLLWLILGLALGLGLGA